MKKLINKIKSKLMRGKKYLPWFLILAYSLVLFDIFFIEGQSDFRFYGLLMPYILAAMLFKFSSKVTLSFCIILLFVIYIKYIFYGPDLNTEEAAVWWVLFFTTGVLQQFKE